MHIMIVMHSQPKLFQIVAALHAPRGFPRPLGTAGSSKPTKMPITAMTTKSSTSVNAERRFDNCMCIPTDVTLNERSLASRYAEVAHATIPRAVLTTTTRVG